ncbi:VOC family protein [Nocardiopsis sp. JB363]|uniref:VOC family protein n=1 Tax=Nocardiopsis sp. JB363 TaxID=1434837 RepID=UPI00097B96E7|nr:VOC family protein [Nocardiopsis sp. JB363]SIO89913.1 hypothetical protein BQ8420_24020 [Nocardiopsis sp. JB363]
MHLDALAIEADDPTALARFWSRALEAPALDRGPFGIEIATPVVSLLLVSACPSPSDRDHDQVTRIHLDLDGGHDHHAHAERLVTLGAERRDIGQGDAPWEVLADPEGNLFCVMPGSRYEGVGPALGSVPVDCARPEVDRNFWAGVLGWAPVDVHGRGLRHPDGGGFVLQFCDELAPKPPGVRNSLTPVLRSGPGEVDPRTRLTDLGARPVESERGSPWRVFADPSGNEFRIPAR